VAFDPGSLAGSESGFQGVCVEVEPRTIYQAKEGERMPIFEFRCLECGELFERLFTDPQEKVDLSCSKCGGTSCERVISRINPIMGTGREGKTPKLATKSCQPGSTCASLEIPGLGD